jgi:hypothetical protein
MPSSQAFRSHLYCIVFEVYGYLKSGIVGLKHNRSLEDRVAKAGLDFTLVRPFITVEGS